VQKFLRKYKFKTWNTITRPIRVLDPWNMRDYDNDKMIVENAAASSDIPGIEEQKNSSEKKKRKKAWPVTLLDPWNRRKFPM
ncbi:hypothetical protein Prudu_010659, partial [Prunus dulcis]